MNKVRFCVTVLDGSAPESDPTLLFKRLVLGDVPARGDFVAIDGGEFLKVEGRTLNMESGGWLVSLERVRMNWDRSKSPLSSYVSVEPDFISILKEAGWEEDDE